MTAFTSLKAAADFLGNGAIEINKYESEIVDIVRRTSVALQRFDSRPATGHPHRYFEETAIGTATFTDPRNISPTPTSPTRVERAVMIKALTAQSNFSLFDVDVTRQQGQFASVEAKDIEDIINAIVLSQATAIWAGTDTSLTAPTTTQYVGLLTQITTQASVAPGASIIDALKAKVAQMVANVTYNVRPTAIYINPVLGDYLDREAKAQKIDLDKVEVTGGVQVKSIMTQAGPLPLIPDPFLQPWTGSSYGFSSPPSGNQTYPAVILTEKMVEMPYVHGGDGNPNPRLFQLGLLSGLQGQYVGVKFDAIVAKAGAYAHAVVGVQRP
jgi:hypothetical protein